MVTCNVHGRDIDLDTGHSLAISRTRPDNLNIPIADPGRGMCRCPKLAIEDAAEART